MTAPAPRTRRNPRVPSSEPRKLELTREQLRDYADRLRDEWEARR